MTTFNLESINKSISITQDSIEAIKSLDLVVEKEIAAQYRIEERLYNDLVMLKLQRQMLIKTNQSGAV